MTRTSSWIGAVVSFAIPGIITIWGVIAFGLHGIAWGQISISAFVATLAYSLLVWFFKFFCSTSFDPVDLMGAFIAPPKDWKAKIFGFIVHSFVGVALAIAGACAIRILSKDIFWLTGALWGLFVGPLALVHFSSLGRFHPGVKKRWISYPGLAGKNYGKATPMSILAGHLVFGLVFGWSYSLF